MTDLGAQVFKGLPAPLHVYRVQGDSGRRDSLRRFGRGGTHAAGRTRSGSRPAPRPLGARQGRTRPRGAAQWRARDRQVAPGSGPEGSHRAPSGPQLGMSLLAVPPGQRPLSADRPLRARAPVRSRRRARSSGSRSSKRGLVRYGLAQPETVALWAAFLSLPRFPTQYPPLDLTPQRQKEKTFEAIVALLLALAAEQPLLFVVEDLHWADPSTRELVDVLFGQVPAASILMLMTSRPEFRPPWAHRSHFTYLTVNRVTRKQTEADGRARDGREAAAGRSPPAGRGQDRRRAPVRRRAHAEWCSNPDLLRDQASATS